MGTCLVRLRRPKSHENRLPRSDTANCCTGANPGRAGDQGGLAVILAANCDSSAGAVSSPGFQDNSTGLDRAGSESRFGKGVTFGADRVSQGGAGGLAERQSHEIRALKSLRFFWRRGGVGQGAGSGGVLET